jgi:hypothetical protein
VIQVRPSTAVTLTAAGFASGMPVGYTLLRAEDASVARPRTTAGVHEVDSLGVYVANLLAPELGGAYLVVWDDGEGGAATEEMLVSTAPTAPTEGGSTPADWTPTVREVGAKLRARTVDNAGNELGTFTSATRPTDTEVTDAIVEEVGALAAWVGPDLPPLLWPLARSAALARVAARIELDYWPEQVRSDRSPYTELAADRDREEARLAEAVASTVGTGSGGGRAVGSLRVGTPSGLAHDYLPVGNLPEPRWPWGGGAGTTV